MLFSNTDLCGEEVLPDYPHNEVRNYGVNHFPEGVFQKCRHVLQKEKEAERERLKKAKRSKVGKKASVGPAVVNMDAWDDEQLPIAQAMDPWDNAGGTPSPAPVSVPAPAPAPAPAAAPPPAASTLPPGSPTRTRPSGTTPTQTPQAPRESPSRTRRANR